MHVAKAQVRFKKTGWPETGGSSHQPT